MTVSYNNGGYELIDLNSWELGDSFPIIGEGKSHVLTVFEDTDPPPQNDAETWSLEIGQSKPARNWLGKVYSSLGGGWHCYGCYVRFGGQWPPASGGPFLSFMDITDGTSIHISVRAVYVDASNMKLSVYDAGSTVVASSSNNPITDDTWYLIECVFERENSGSAKVYVTEAGSSPVEVIDCGSGNDFYSGTDAIAIKHWGQNGLLLAFPTTTYIGSSYITKGNKDDTDIVGPFEVWPFRIGEDGAVADCSKTGASPGSTLSSGVYEEVSDDLNAFSPRYDNQEGGACATTTTNTYGIPGPFGAMAWNSQIIGASWLYQLSGPVSGNDIGIIWGYEEASTYIVSSELTGLSRNRKFYKKVESYGIPPTRVPNADVGQYFVQGFYNDAAVNGTISVYCNECWVFAMVRSPVAPLGVQTVDILGNTDILGLVNIK